MTTTIDGKTAACGYGRTRDLPDRPLSIDHYADEVVGSLKHLGVPNADFFGFSFDGRTPELAVVPDAGHFAFMSEPSVVPVSDWLRRRHRPDS